MRAILDFVKATVAGGFFVILPVVLLWLVLVETIDVAIALVTPLAEQFPVDSLGGIEIARITAIVTVLLVCFVTGAILRTAIGGRIWSAIERRTLGMIPGYDLIKNLTRRFSGTAAGTQFAPAAVQTSEGVTELAFIIEEHAGGNFTVFFPLAPMPNIGSIRFVEPERIRKLDAPMGPVVGAIMNFGVGSGQLVEGGR